MADTSKANLAPSRAGNEDGMWDDSWSFAGADPCRVGVWVDYAANARALEQRVQPTPAPAPEVDPRVQAWDDYEKASRKITAAANAGAKLMKNMRPSTPDDRLYFEQDS